MITERDLEEFERTGYARDTEVVNQYRACSLAYPAPTLNNARKINARVIQETPKAYKFKTKNSEFWAPKSVCRLVDHSKGIVYLWDKFKPAWKCRDGKYRVNPFF